MVQEQIEIMERFYGPPPPRSYWQPVKDAWNLYTCGSLTRLVGNICATCFDELTVEDEP